MSAWPIPLDIDGEWEQFADAEYEAHRAATPTTIGHRTARDLRHGTPPPQLAGAFLTSEGPTVLYARGGTGKGMMACWFR